MDGNTILRRNGACTTSDGECKATKKGKKTKPPFVRCLLVSEMKFRRLQHWLICTAYRSYNPLLLSPISESEGPKNGAGMPGVTSPSLFYIGEF